MEFYFSSLMLLCNQRLPASRQQEGAAIKYQ